MNFLKRLGIKISEGIRSIFGTRPGGTYGAKTKIKELKKAGIENTALKRFNQFRKIFKSKYGKDIYSKGLTEREKMEAEDIIFAFTEDKTSTLEGIEETYNKIKDLPGVKDVTDVAEMSRQVDIAANRERAARIYSVLTSDVVRDAWSSYKDNEYNNENVAIMDKAIELVTDELEDDPDNIFLTEGQRLDKIIAKYKELKGEGE